MSPPPPSLTLPSPNTHSAALGQASASPGLVSPLQAVQIDAAVALTLVEYSALPLPSAITQSCVSGTHDTALRLLPLSATCLWSYSPQYTQCHSGWVVSLAVFVTSRRSGPFS